MSIQSSLRHYKLVVTVLWLQICITDGRDIINVFKCLTCASLEYDIFKINIYFVTWSIKSRFYTCTMQLNTDLKPRINFPNAYMYLHTMKNYVLLSHQWVYDSIIKIHQHAFSTTSGPCKTECKLPHLGDFAMHLLSLMPTLDHHSQRRTLAKLSLDEALRNVLKTHTAFDKIKDIDSYWLSFLFCLKIIEHELSI